MSYFGVLFTTEITFRYTYFLDFSLDVPLLGTVFYSGLESTGG
jgi:hypothetical protein